MEEPSGSQPKKRQRGAALPDEGSADEEREAACMSPLSSSALALPPLTLEDLRDRFHMPLRHAASELSVSVARLLRLCRVFGVLRWPYRQVRSVRESMEELRRELDSPVLPLSPDVKHRLVRKLEHTTRKHELVVLFACRGLEAGVREILFTSDASDVAARLSYTARSLGLRPPRRSGDGGSSGSRRGTGISSGGSASTSVAAAAEGAAEVAVDEDVEPAAAAARPGAGEALGGKTGGGPGGLRRLVDLFTKAELDQLLSQLAEDFSSRTSDSAAGALMSLAASGGGSGGGTGGCSAVARNDRPGSKNNHGSEIRRGEGNSNNGNGNGSGRHGSVGSLEDGERDGSAPSGGPGAGGRSGGGSSGGGSVTSSPPQPRPAAVMSAAAALAAVASAESCSATSTAALAAAMARRASRRAKREPWDGGGAAPGGSSADGSPPDTGPTAGAGGVGSGVGRSGSDSGRYGKVAGGGSSSSGGGSGGGDGSSAQYHRHGSYNTGSDDSPNRQVAGSGSEAGYGAVEGGGYGAGEGTGYGGVEGGVYMRRKAPEGGDDDACIVPPYMIPVMANMGYTVVADGVANGGPAVLGNGARMAAAAVGYGAYHVGSPRGDAAWKEAMVSQQPRQLQQPSPQAAGWDPSETMPRHYGMHMPSFGASLPPQVHFSPQQNHLLAKQNNLPSRQNKLRPLQPQLLGPPQLQQSSLSHEGDGGGSNGSRRFARNAYDNGYGNGGGGGYINFLTAATHGAAPAGAPWMPKAPAAESLPQLPTSAASRDLSTTASGHVAGSGGGDGGGGGSGGFLPPAASLLRVVEGRDEGQLAPPPQWPPAPGPPRPLTGLQQL